MSTVKTDAITAVSTNGDLSLDGLGTGGVSIASTLKMTKGGDISSASPLVIDVDGNYFDVTGTTNFAAMTVESGNFFMLQFDGALTITHGSGIELPGAANLTTATGDRLICYATAADTVEVMSVETEAAVGGGTKEFWVGHHGGSLGGAAVYAHITQVGHFQAQALSDSHWVGFVFMVPNDYTSLTDAVVVSIADASETQQWDAEADFGSNQQASTTHEVDDLNATKAVTSGELEDMDVSDAFVGIVAGDYVALRFTSNTTAVSPIGLRIRYA